MRPAIQTASVLALLSVVGATPAVVRAQARVTTLEGDRWSDVVSGLAEELTSEGTVLALCVRRDEGGACLPCSEYTLSLDPAAAQAFAIGACDPRTGATTVRLVHRAALFDHAHAVPVPRALGISAELVSGVSSESATPRSAGSGIGCSVRVRPYVRDLEHGVVVFLRPDAYEVRVARARFHVDPSADGDFVISSTDTTSTELSYDVIDRATGTVIVVGHATFTCTSSVDVPATDPGAVSPTPSSHALASPIDDANAIPRGTSVQGSGIRLVPRDEARSTADGLVGTGIAIATASALTLIGIGFASLVQASPECTSYDVSYVGSGSLGATVRVCAAWGPARPTTTPAELSWATLGTLGGGLMLIAIGWLTQATLPALDDDALRVSLDAGPDQGSLRLTGRF